MIKNDKVYDAFKWIARVLLPALATLYFALSEIWGFPYPVKVIGTISAVNIFLATIVGVSHSNYRKAEAEMTASGGSSAAMHSMGGSGGLTYRCSVCGAPAASSDRKCAACGGPVEVVFED